jgi:hypothetical protein
MTIETNNVIPLIMIIVATAITIFSIYASKRKNR